MMHYEPDTIWGRTVQGEIEVAAPRNGLSLGQRRILKWLDTPRTFAALAAKHRLEVSRLEHELVRLAQLQLVAFQRPGAAQPRTAPWDRPSAIAEHPSRAFSIPPWPLCAGAVALGIGLVLLVMT